MWKNLPKNQKDKYKKIITHFASLSESFAQKSTDDEIVAPIVNSKFQETAFQASFNATSEDIKNTSYDASILTDNNEKYIVGIKSFGIHSGAQKIAQFKKSSPKWEDITEQISNNKKNIKEKNNLKVANYPLYLKIAKKLSNLRNERIRSSRAQLIGFNDSPDIESVYHVLMPSKKDENPQITVGETDYSEIDVDNIEILGCTTKNGNPNNFKFKDPYHEYKYSSSDSQLSMDFRNQEIAVEKWDIKYVENAISFFENMNIQHYKEPYESYSWIIYDKKGIVQQYSGFNAFNGQSKLARKNMSRENRINSIIEQFKPFISKNDSIKIKKYLEKILLKSWKTNEEKSYLNKIRYDFIQYVKKLNNKSLTKSIKNTIYRPAYEVYIPIPDSRTFHNNHPNFFKKNIGKFKSNKSKKLLLDKKDRTFNLRILPSNEIIKAYIDQDDGKAIQSYNKQTILGEWLIKKVFQLNDREILTKSKLDDLGFNGIKLIKNTEENCIDLKFVYINPQEPPRDAIGWISDKK